MADGTYDNGLEQLSIADWRTGGLDIHVLILEQDAGLAFDRSHATVTAVLAPAGNTEATGTGYERKAVPTRTAAIVAGDKVKLDHGDILYELLDAGELGAAVYFVEGAGDGDRIPVFYKDEGFPFTSNGTDFFLKTGASGLVELKDAV